jgi:carboxyl-terminal processing protease
MTSENKNKNIVYFPIIIFLTLTMGFLLGRLVYKNNNSILISNYSKTDKISILLSLIDKNYVDTISIEKLIESAIPKILEDLDPHSIYIPATEFAESQEPLDGSFEGIGVQFNVQNDTILIIDVISGGPSEKEGLLPGDRIITINDSLFAGKNITSDDVVKNLKGEKGTEVKLGIQRAEIADLIYYTITRDKIPLYSVDASYMYDNEIGYIKISRFAQTTYDEFMVAVNKLKKEGMQKLILDLRGNSGGYLIEATDIADEFLTENKMIVYTQGKSRPKLEYFATNKDECIDIELVILVDTWSASASEILSGAIQDNDRGLIIGRRTYGKGLVQEPVTFNDGSSLRLTVARYYTPTGRSIQKPYGKNSEEYDLEIYERIENGELNHIDSTFFADSLKYITPEGKIVYGGGGIMPDIFVPVDTLGYSRYFDKLSAKSLIYKFGLEYSDKNRNILSKYTTSDKLIGYLESQDLISKLKFYADKNGVFDTYGELAISREIIKIQLYSYIVRNIIDENNFYKVYHQIDNVFLRAVDELKNKNEK